MSVGINTMALPRKSSSACTKKLRCWKKLQYVSSRYPPLISFLSAVRGTVIFAALSPCQTHSLLTTVEGRGANMFMIYSPISDPTQQYNLLKFCQILLTKTL